MIPRYTVDSFVIHTIMPAEGWKVVWWNDTQGHWLAPIHALALVTRIVREATTLREVMEVPSARQNEFREIVGMEYSPLDGWNICEDDANFCALLAPDWTLAAYEATDNCRHAVQEVQP